MCRNLLLILGILSGIQVPVHAALDITLAFTTLWKIRAWTIPAMLPIPKVGTAFNEEGVPAEPEAMEKRAMGFVQELLWCIKAKSLMEAKG